MALDLLHAWNWLVANNLLKDIISWTVAFTLGTCVAWLPLKRMKRRQDRINDQLDPTTPGGLGDVDAQLKELLRELGQKE